jgi:hypothetical protein
MCTRSWRKIIYAYVLYLYTRKCGSKIVSLCIVYSYNAQRYNFGNFGAKLGDFGAKDGIFMTRDEKERSKKLHAIQRIGFWNIIFFRLFWGFLFVWGSWTIKTELYCAFWCVEAGIGPRDVPKPARLRKRVIIRICVYECLQEAIGIKTADF